MKTTDTKEIDGPFVSGPRKIKIKCLLCNESPPRGRRRARQQGTRHPSPVRGGRTLQRRRGESTGGGRGRPCLRGLLDHLRPHLPLRKRGREGQVRRPRTFLGPGTSRYLHRGPGQGGPDLPDLPPLDFSGTRVFASDTKGTRV